MDIRYQDRLALDALRKLVRMVPSAQLTAPTPCDEWNVRDLIDHMNREHEAIAQPLLDHTVALDPDPRVAFEQAADRWSTAFASDRILDQHVLVPRYDVRLPGRSILSVHLVDMLAHHWDIAKAIEVDLDPPAHLLDVALSIAQNIPASGPLRGPGRAYAAPVPIPANANALDLLVAALGRSPSWSPPTLDGDTSKSAG